MSAAIAVAAVPDDDRPVIRLGTELHEVVDAAVEALALDPHLYQRTGHLVHVTREVGEGPVIRQVGVANMRERLTACARWERLEKKKRGDEVVVESVRCLPPDTVVNACLHPGRCGDKVRPLMGIIEAPSLRPDFSIIEEPGYDVATGYLYEPSATFPRVPSDDKLTQATGRRGWTAVSDWLGDFPLRGEADRAACAAGALTVLARPAILGATPAVIVDASTPGSGKTLIVDCIAIMTTGRGAPRMTFSEDVDEVAKNLGACALQGERIVAFDNIAIPFGGGPIDMVLTADDAVKLRILGKSETPDTRWRACIFGTANNASWKGDTFRRVLAPRLEPTVENPEERTGFAHEDLRAWMRENRPRLVVAALSMLRAFHLAGAPRGGVKLWGSFEAWSKIIPAAIVWAGGADPMGCRPSADEDARDEERAGVGVIMSAILRLAPADGPGVTARGITDLLWPSDRMKGHPGPPDGFDDAREAIEALTHTPSGKKPDASKLGYILRKWRRRVVGERRLVVAPDRTGVARWGVQVREGAAVAVKDEKEGAGA